MAVSSLSRVRIRIRAALVAFATAIRHALDIGMPLEKILEKMTTLPRSVMQPALKERGDAGGRRDSRSDGV